MDILITVLNTLVVIIALLLIGLILIQPSKSGGFGSAFGGVGESVFGAQTMGHLSKLTVVMASLFFLIVLTLAILIAHRAQPKGVLDNLGDKTPGANAAKPFTPATEKDAPKAPEAAVPAAPAVEKPELPAVDAKKDAAAAATVPAVEAVKAPAAVPATAPAPAAK